MVGGKATDQGEHGQATAPRTQSRNAVDSAGACAGSSTQRQAGRFTALLHHVTVDLLRDSYHAPEAGSGARSGWRDVAGVRDRTWKNVWRTCISGSTGHLPRAAVKRATSRKPTDGKRPLGIAALEDKIVQQAVVTVLNQIYEEDFLGFSYGFRPGRSQHDALDALWVGIMRKKVNWVLDADVRGFFDNIVHEWLVKFIEHRIADRRMLRLIQKWLKAGVSEEGEWSKTKVGTPQGAVASPLLANIYLHYVFDLWVKQWRKTSRHGRLIVVRYADDFVVGFQHRHDAERSCGMEERLEKFGLEPCTRRRRG